jgi:hypothetical protein
VYNERERDREAHIFFEKNLKKIKNNHPPKKKCPVNRAQD